MAETLIDPVVTAKEIDEGLIRWHLALQQKDHQ